MIVLYRKVFTLRRSLGSSLVLILFLALSMNSFIQVRGEEASPLIKTRHVVEIREGGLIIINDTFTLSTPPNVTFVDVANFFMGFPSHFMDHLDYYALYQWNDDGWIALEGLEEEANDTRGFRVTLQNPVRLEGNMTLTLRGIFLFSEVVYSYENDLIAFFPLYPSLPANISTSDVEVKLPKGAVLTAVDPKVFSNSSVEGVYILSYNQSSLPPFQQLEATVTYLAGSSSNMIVRCEELQRTIDLTSLSQIRILDTYTLLNLGPQLTSYTTNISLNAFDLDAKDYLEHLTIMSTSFEKEGCKKIIVVPTISIETGEGWVFTVEYSLPLKEYAERSLGNEFHLNYFFLSNFSFTVRHLEVTVILPEGGEYSSSTPASGAVRKVGPFTQEVYYRMENTTVLDDLDLHFAYVYNPLWTTFRPTLWSCLLVLATVGIYQIFRSKKPREREVSEGRLSLRRFIELYEEKLTLSAEEEKIEESMNERRISRSEYNRRTETLGSRVSNIENSLKSFKERIKQEAPQFEKVLREIEAAESEMKTQKTNLRELEARLRGRSISRDAYRRLRQEYLSRIRRARSRIERAILSLREGGY
jgi:hypothetical protein